MGEAEVLLVQLRALEQRVDELQLTHQLISSLDKNLAVQVMVLENIKEENRRQNQQLQDFAVMVAKINENVLNIAQNQREQSLQLEAYSQRLSSVEAELSAEKKRFLINTADLQRETTLAKLKDTTTKIGIPAGLGVLLYELIQKFLGK